MESVFIEYEQFILNKQMQNNLEKINKTSADAIKKASDRYYQNRDQLLRDKALFNIKKSGALPLLTTMTKHNITWEDIARCLARNQGRNAKNPKVQKKPQADEKNF